MSRPLLLLIVVSVLSLAARVALLDEPCRVPCRTGSNHLLVFDESYYVNAARVIAGIEPRAGMTYAGSPLGDDPNAEHPQLAKLVIAGSIELFGDGPFAWRIGSILCGSLAILGMFALVRAGGGGPWLALGAAALMAADNLLLVMSRIGTLDIYVLAAMLWAAVLYLRGHPLWAGVVLGVGACAKEVGPYLLLVVGLFEALRLWSTRGRGWRPRVGAFGGFTAMTAGVFVALVAVMDEIAPPWNPQTGKVITGGPFAHISHILSYGAAQTSPRGPTGIASYPWQWLGDYKPISYLTINPKRPAPGLYHIHPAAHFLGMISPPILALALPGLGFAAWRVWRASPNGALAGLSVAWFLGTWIPYELLSLIDGRTSYLYYMVIVMPGIYLAVAQLIARIGPRRKLVLVWMFAVLVAAVVMFPFTPWP
jgi:predicted membrane-bound dolichyl-phosphate-mannose-protein mannosyltransferase